jgi:hypothetical protein
MRKLPPGFSLSTLALTALAGTLTAIFRQLGARSDWNLHVPEFVLLMLAAGAVYAAAVWLTYRRPLGVVALVVILGTAVALRAFLLPLTPALSADVYRYGWEGRVQRAGMNPYTIHPAMPELKQFRSRGDPLDSTSATPTAYPPLSEWSFAWAETPEGYKQLYTAFDLLSIVLLLLLLRARREALHRVLAYAWNPTVVVSFAMCGHHDSLAIATLLLALLFIISGRAALSIAALAASFLAKFFAALLLPVFLRHTRAAYAGLFVAIVAVAYLPYLGAGTALFNGLLQYSAAWQNNDSLFRLILAAGNSPAQARLVAAVLTLALIALAVRQRLDPLRASFLLLAGLLLLSPNAFPWYFTWTVPFLCFFPNPPWLLMSVVCVLGYAPMIQYSAGFGYNDSPLVLALEYAPVLAWLVWEGLTAAWGGPGPGDGAPDRGHGVPPGD